MPSVLSKMDQLIPKKPRMAQINAPPIPLVREEEPKVEKHQTITFKLCSNPTNQNSQNYELTIPYFHSGTPKQWVKVRKEILKVITGTNITMGAGKYVIAHHVLTGNALASFNTAATDTSAENNVNFVLIMNTVTSHIFQYKVILHIIG